jgi:hypothetical protein
MPTVHSAKWFGKQRAVARDDVTGGGVGGAIIPLTAVGAGGLDACVLADLSSVES